MTEQEWLTCSGTHSMLTFLRVRGSDRKVILFDVVCCRRIRHLLTPTACEILTQIERDADEPLSTEALDALITAADREREQRGMWATAKELSLSEAAEAVHRAAGGYLGGAAAKAAVAVAFADSSAATWRAGDGFLDPDPVERVAQAALLRDIFGNPFLPVIFSPEWRTDTAVSLARTMYDSRDFAAMPILADALQDAGCDELAILDHCRQSGEHVRGCWVVDLVLGKE